MDRANMWAARAVYVLVCCSLGSWEAHACHVSVVRPLSSLALTWDLCMLAKLLRSRELYERGRAKIELSRSHTSTNELVSVPELVTVLVSTLTS